MSEPAVVVVISSVPVLGGRVKSAPSPQLTAATAAAKTNAMVESRWVGTESHRWNCISAGSNLVPNMLGLVPEWKYEFRSALRAAPHPLQPFGGVDVSKCEVLNS